MIALSNLTMQYGQKILFENVTMRLDPGKRYGIVGANGSGKTTLLRLISGEDQPVDGEISFSQETKIGALRQDHFQYESQRVIDVILQGKPVLWEAINEKERLLKQGVLEAESGHRLGELEEIISRQNGYNAESFASELLSGLGIASDCHFDRMSKLSGGFKLRVLLAQLLFQEPDVLLLDEPTNHLDIVSIAWLENFLSNVFPSTTLLVSHDRDFLNAVCRYIIDVDFQTIDLYSGNYDQFVKNKALLMEQKQKEHLRLEKKQAEMKLFVDRFRAKASKARQAQSRLKQIERIQFPQIKKSSRVSPQLQFAQKRHSGKEVLHLRGISKSFDTHRVLHDVNFTAMRGDKIAIIGQNGIGKSTLLKIVTGELKADVGTCVWGYETHCSYFAQDQSAILAGLRSAEKKSVYEWLYQFAPQESIGTIRGLLARVLFSGDDVYKKLEALSGGETTRLILAKMMLEKGNVLILDEPTNHLDLQGVEALESALRAFEGTLLFVTHDRRFVANVATRILALTTEGVRNYDGTYAEYVKYYDIDYLDRMAFNVRAKKKQKNSEAPSRGYNSVERQELKRLVNQISKKNIQLEKSIELQENEIAAIDAQFSAAEFYKITTPEQIQALQQRKEKLSVQLSADFQMWEKLLCELESMQARLMEAG